MWGSLQHQFDSICETDIDNDGLSVSDLLLLLGDFGTTCTE